MTTLDTISNLNSAIKRRLSIKPKRKLILPTDRGTQFSNSKSNVIKDYYSSF